MSINDLFEELFCRGKKEHEMVAEEDMYEGRFLRQEVNRVYTERSNPIENNIFEEMRMNGAQGKSGSVAFTWEH